jgi:peptide/nickel transport system substrate-binding protein
VPDLATAAPVVSNGGKTYKLTIRTGAMWDTSPARQVTGADVVRGVERDCNPAQPFGGMPDFESLIAGDQQFCAGFAKVKPTVAAMKAYINSHNISGVSAQGQTVTFNLNQPAAYFPDMLTMDAFAAAPVESLNYVPASAQAQQHVIADGPYAIQSYTPARQIVFVRNPAWKASSDPLRKAYVNKIVVSETGNVAGVQQQLQTNSANASMEWDAFPPLASEPGLIKQMQSGLNHNYNLGPSESSNPYFVFNTVSKNNNGAMGKKAVRQAISYALNRKHLDQVINPIINPPLTHVLPPEVNGSTDLPSSYNPYPYNPTKAKQLLAAAGYKNGLTVIMLYRPSTTTGAALAHAAQSDLAKVGIKLKLLGVPDSDFYTKYMEVPTVAQRSVWDMSMTSWQPDWYAQGSVTYFKPLFDGSAAYPPIGSNFGFYNNPTVNAEINANAFQGNVTTAEQKWLDIDKQIMSDAAIYPITASLQPNYHASYVHNAVYIPAIQNFDPTNVWLSSPGS